MSQFYRYTLCIDPRAVGKLSNDEIYKLNQTKTVTGTVQDFIQWNYIQGRALVPSQFDHETPLNNDERTHRRSSRWQASQLILVDVDEAPGVTLKDIISDPFVKAHAAAVYPSSSYTPDTVKAHILFPLSQMVDQAVQYQQLGAEIVERLSFPVDNSTLNPAQAVFGTVYRNEPMVGVERRLDDNLLWLNKNYAELDVQLILAERVALNKYVLEPSSPVRTFDGEISKRAQTHLDASDEQRTTVTLDALQWALTPEWGEQGHQERFTLLVAAFAGSNDTRVRDAFLNYSSPRWDVSQQKKSLAHWWSQFRVRESGGLTVATLFAEARKHGWLQRSSVELRGAEQINEADITNWITESNIPERLLLKSPTGSGKTNGAIALLKRLQSEKEKPVKAVFFAPSIKLCHALSASLSHAGVENTLYIEGGRRTKDKETLKSAQVLVTTLQTFAVKVFLSVKASAYDLVVMDECDELLSAFVRSGINGKVAAPSHVDKTQSRLGVEALQALLRDAGQVLMLDGTMTELSRYMMYAWAGHKQIGVYENVYSRDKAPVTLYGTLQTLRDDVVNQVKEGKRVVIACDTKAEAQRIETLLLLTESVAKDKVLRITGDTASDERVNHFFRNVEEGAKQYPVIIYNSAMGSGVSITEVTPDIVYLFGTYLTPRKLLQMLNRYRSQGEVRAYVQSSETLYSLSVADKYVQLVEAAKVEEVLAGIERLERDDLATIVTNAALIVATDEYEQTRSVREFFTRLILDDGREVKHHWTTTAIYEEESKQVQALIKEAKEDTCRTWRSVPPIKRGDPFPQGISAEDAARGLLHGYITEIFPNLNTEIEDAEIARLALSFGRRRSVIKRWIEPESIMSNVIDELQNTRKESVTYRLYLARIELITQLYILFPDTEDKYNDSDQSERAKRFIEEVKKRQAVYDLIAPYEYRFEAINRSDKTEVEKAIALARQALKQIGLSIKRDNGKRMEGKRDRRSRIDGTADLNNFLTLSGLSNVDAVRDFNYSRFTASMADARSAAERFNKMKPAAKREVLKDMEALSASQSIPFSTLIDIQESRSFAL